MQTVRGRCFLLCVSALGAQHIYSRGVGDYREHVEGDAHKVHRLPVEKRPHDLSDDDGQLQLALVLRVKHPDEDGRREKRHPPNKAHRVEQERQRRLNRNEYELVAERELPFQADEVSRDRQHTRDGAARRTEQEVRRTLNNTLHALHRKDLPLAFEKTDRHHQRRADEHHNISKNY